MAGSLSHPLFARFYVALGAAADRAGAAEHRRELTAGLNGKVIEVGAGQGLNFRHFPITVSQVVAVEPEPYLRQHATKAAVTAPVPINVIDGTAAHLPAEDGEFDAGVASLVLCSVADDAALAELYRVIRAGGELRFYEHVRAGSPRHARLQDRADRVWPFLFGGCHPNRHSEAAIKRAGFNVEEHRQFVFQPCFMTRPVAPHVIGRARRP